MNEVLKQLRERKSVRIFTDTPVSAEDKRAILAAAAEAPTAGNQQLYTILDITDTNIKAQLAETCDHQSFIADAPVVLIFLADFQKWYDAFSEAGCEPRKPGAGDLMLAIDDALIAAQNAVTAAHSLGMGSCYIGDVMENCEIHRELLKLPHYVFTAAMLVIGYPTQQQLARKKPERCPMEFIVHENSYHEMHGEELKKLFENHSGDKKYEEWCKAFCKRKYNSEFSREMTRSVSEYLKSFQTI